jgi:hypothetical protein
VVEDHYSYKLKAIAQAVIDLYRGGGRRKTSAVFLRFEPRVVMSKFSESQALR